MSESSSQEYFSMVAAKGLVKLVDIDRTLRMFWEIEEVKPLKPQFSEEEAFCEERFIATTKLDESKHFVVQLPFKQPPTKLGGTLSVAIRRLQGMEKRFNRDPEFKRLYCAFMNEYREMGHMAEIAESQISQRLCFYLPHHGVIRNESTTTKLRVVFDGSAKSTTGISLNDCLAAGPVVQPSLFTIIMRFREYPVVFSADAEKMYRMVKLATSDTEYQRIVWRNDTSDPIKHFRLLTVTYGLTSASYLATRSLLKISETYAESYPQASSIIGNCFYVDDLMSGAQTFKEASQIIENLNQLLGKHGFKLRKWKSNCPLALSSVPENLRDTSAKDLIDHDVANHAVKVLGISWNPKKDIFTFNFKQDLQKSYTKRGVLSAAGKLFDPMGWLSPTTVMVKLFMQQLWCKRLDWDDELPEELNRKWLSILCGLNQLECITFPRHIGTDASTNVEIHGFCDASTKAFAAVVYFRFLDANSQVTVRLVSSKIKVAPMKQQSLPRLELCLAVLLAKLVHTINQESGVQISNCKYWTDSKIVLDWLQSYPRRWSTFVGNRTSEIQSLSKPEQWNHVPSAFNPADCASRGMSPIELKDHDIWWRGPKWLSEEQHRWPVQSKHHDTTEEKANTMFTFRVTIENKWLDAFLWLYSSYQRAQRVLGYVLRFIKVCKKPKHFHDRSKSLLREELVQVEEMLCKHEQSKFYANELAALKAKTAVANTSSLKCLSPFVDKFGILRVGGRLHHSLAPYATKHPIILHCKSRISWLLLQDEHIYSKHAGPSLMMSLIKQYDFGFQKENQKPNPLLPIVLFVPDLTPSSSSN